MLGPAAVRQRGEEARNRTRTGDPFLTMEVLYQLSYPGGAINSSGAAARCYGRARRSKGLSRDQSLGSSPSTVAEKPRRLTVRRAPGPVETLSSIRISVLPLSSSQSASTESIVIPYQPFAAGSST
jgi:hypothetical protein